MSEQRLLSSVVSTYIDYNPLFNLFKNSSYRASYYRNYLHQVYLMTRLAFQRPIRVIVADEIGLGKTVEAIRILKHLQFVDGIRKILIIVPPILLDQWIVKDLRNLGIKATLIHRNNIDELYERAERREISEGIFIGSMDTLKLSKNDEVEVTRHPYFEFINSVDWDLVIVDEVHKLFYTKNSPSLRYERIGSFICRNRAKHCILLTATPHRGRTDDFLARLVLLDKSFPPRPSELGNKVERYGLRMMVLQLITDVIFFRRVKEDVNKLEGKEIFKPAHQYPVLIHVPEEIREIQLKILDFVTLGLDRYYTDPKLRGIRELLRKLIIKRAMSSEQALLSTFMKIGAKRGGVAEEEIDKLRNRLEEYLSGEEEPEKEIDDDVGRLIEAVSLFVDPIRSVKLKNEVKEIVESVRKLLEKGKSPKINALVDIVDLVLNKESLNELGKEFRDIYGGRIIVFTEFRDTAHQIFSQLRQTLGERKAGLISYAMFKKARKLEEEYASQGRASKDLLKFINIIPLTKDKLVGFALLTSESKKYLSVFQKLLEDSRLATVILISTDVAAEGLNLQSANIVINYEITWSPMKRDQRVGRVWRLGQKRDVYIFDFHMGTDFERSILERFTVKVITIAEETGYTTLRYKGLVFYIPYSIASEEDSYALRVVEMEEFHEGTVLDNIYSALRKAYMPNKLDVKILGEELSRLAVDIIRFTKKLRRELELLSRFRTNDPEKVRREIKLLLGFEDETEALNSAVMLLELFSKLGMARVEEINQALIVNGKRVDRGSLRDLVDALSEIIHKSANHSIGSEKPLLFFIKDYDFESAFLTFLVVESKEGHRLYLEPMIVSKKNNRVIVLRGYEFVKELSKALSKSSYTFPDNVTYKAILDIYHSVGRELKNYVDEISRLVHEKPKRYVFSKELAKLRFSECKLIPNGSDPIVKIQAKPVAVFLKSIRPVSFTVSERPRAFTVSPEKKEIIKNVSENLVKTYFESLGYKVEKRSEYSPYDFELYDSNGNLAGYVEVKGHETDEPIVELSHNEFNFAQQNKNKYLICVVTSVLDSPKIKCVSFDELQKIGVFKIEIHKYIYKLKGG